MVLLSKDEEITILYITLYNDDGVITARSAINPTLLKTNDHDNSPVGIFSRRNTVYNCTNRTLLELPTSRRDNCQNWCRELADFHYRNVRHLRWPIASRINRQQYESRKCDISRYIVTTNFLQRDFSSEFLWISIKHAIQNSYPLFWNENPIQLYQK